MTSSTKDIPPSERIEYVNAVWLLENEADGTYASFGERIGRSRQEVNRFLRPDPTYGISRRMAMRIEGGFNKPEGWLSKDHGHPAPRQSKALPKQTDSLFGYSNSKVLSQLDEHTEYKSRIAQSVELSIQKSFDERLMSIVERLVINPFTGGDKNPAITALADSRSLFNMSLRMQERVVAIERIAIDNLTQMNEIKLAMGIQSFFSWHPQLIASGVMDLIIEFDIKGYPKRHLLCSFTDPQKLVAGIVDNCTDVKLFLEEIAALTNDLIIDWFDCADIIERFNRCE